MDIEIDYSLCETKEIAFEKVQSTVQADMLSSKFGVSAAVSYDQDKLSATVSGKGYSINFTFEETKLTGELKLSFLLKPLKKKIISTLEKQLTKIL